jgi:uncharacterized protein DUF4412
MRNCFRLALVFMVAVVFAAGCGGGGKKAPTDFSAEMISKMGKMTQKSKVYTTDGKWRMESTVQGRRSISIIRPDKKMVWLLMPAQKMYMAQKYSDKDLESTQTSFPGELKREKIKSEKVNGVKATKYLIVYDGGNGKTKVYQWMSADHFPVKTAALDGSWWTEYRNFKPGKQAAKLFELPAGYKKFEMPTNIGGMKLNF